MYRNTKAMAAGVRQTALWSDELHGIAYRNYKTSQFQESLYLALGACRAG